MRATSPATIARVAAAGRKVLLGHDPTTISGLTSRYRADSVTGVANGANVASWPDSSGNSYTATNSTTSAQPTYLSTGQGGRSAVRFNGGVQSRLNSAAPTGDTNQTIVAVFSLNSTSGTNTIRGATAANGLQFSTVTAKPTNVAQNTKALGASSATMTTAPSVVISTFASASGSTWRLNGTAAGSNATTQTLTAQGLVLGCNPNQPNEYLYGDIYELFSFNKILSTAEQALIDSYVQDYYAITVSDYA